jgi:hypothetical protein
MRNDLGRDVDDDDDDAGPLFVIDKKQDSTKTKISKMPDCRPRGRSSILAETSK